MDQAALAQLIMGALHDLYDQEGDIIQQDVGERTICGSLACLLRAAFPEHRVHVEYNRRWEGIEPKELELPDANGDLTDKRVFPDIVVHHPGNDEANLLAIEVKKTTSRYGDDRDIAKLEKLCLDLRYHHGLFLRLPAGEGAAFDGIVANWFQRP